MHVLRGRGDSLAADRGITADLDERVRDTGEPVLRVWRPHRHVAFGPRDATHDGYDRARALARDAGFPPFDRSVGGRPVAFTGRTVAVALAEPADREALGLRERYDRAMAGIRGGLASLGATLEADEPPNSFCPGSHSLSVESGKVVGLAQRVTGDVARVGGVVLVDDHETIGDVLAPVYDALDVPLDPETVGSLALDGVTVDPVTVCRSIEDALVGDRETRVTSVRET